MDALEILLNEVGHTADLALSDGSEVTASKLRAHLLQFGEAREEEERGLGEPGRIDKPRLAADLINLGNPDERFTLNEVEDAIDALASQEGESGEGEGIAEIRGRMTSREALSAAGIDYHAMSDAIDAAYPAPEGSEDG